MGFSISKSWMILAFIFLPFVASAKLSGADIDIFKKSCKTAWMKDTEKVVDKTEYKDFGEKYCNCMADKPMDTDDDMKDSAHLCVSQTLLQTSMETAERELGADNLSESKIRDACIAKWNVIYNGLTGDSKPQASTFCDCAAGKLSAMNANRDNLTDEEWDKEINKIAASCPTSKSDDNSNGSNSVSNGSTNGSTGTTSSDDSTATDTSN